MILDSSGVIATILAEPGHGRLLDALADASNIGIGAPIAVETATVLVARFGTAGPSMLSRFLDENDVAMIPFGQAHWSVAARARLRYGKGRHPANLNFGDCLSYASAKVADQPLLFVGDDFPKTDIAVA